MTESKLLRPAQVLFERERQLPDIPAVDHYAGSEKFMRRALALQAEMGPVFDVTLDCEDGAPAGNEKAHAKMCAELAVSSENRHGRVGVRIHDLTHPHWLRDLETILPIAAGRLAYLTVPKVRSARDVRTVREAMRPLLPPGTRPPPLHVLIETPEALAEVARIAHEPGVECLDFGLMDFVSSHRGAIGAEAMRSPLQFEHPLIRRAKAEIAAAAHAATIVPAHNVCTELEDASLVYADAHRARTEFAFLRMWSIHPNQIRPILEAMQPSAAEIEDAVRILTAAQDAAWGPIRDAGHLHDRASYRYYWAVLQQARRTGIALADEILHRFFGSES
ncbi:MULTISPECIES: HpcH/HpaI aldolase/citrate lyase family protein [Tepidiphilus]|uniref:Citrate lyase beta subunit n=1 Tax=Tepidiphilus thermophilus TaxID=876478 RepID=A0A0K6IW66_9PROT|nr:MULTISPECIES: aldolase/citrate lyase family protein [Tepidiphilus]MBI5780268.1 CoA ester lyase [Rhodocyclales bacterium]MDK2797836.1 citrate lyase subunit beta / citryl-CoA lyase [Tepidiphilus sp.]CUB07366.1 Citrate lyase beta subunit [Tepidiphilus thermophilus]